MVKVSLLLLSCLLTLAAGAPNSAKSRSFVGPLHYGVYSVEEKSMRNEVSTEDTSQEDTSTLTTSSEAATIQTGSSSTPVSSSSETTLSSTSPSTIQISSTTELTSTSEITSTPITTSTTASHSTTTMSTTLILESSTSHSSISERSTSHSSISSIESTAEVSSAATTTQDSMKDTSVKTTTSSESTKDTSTKLSTELSSTISHSSTIYSSTPSLPTTTTPKPPTDKDILEQAKTILQEIQDQYNSLLSYLNQSANNTVVPSRLNRDDEECTTDICKSLTGRMDQIENRVDDVDSWTLQDNDLINLQKDSDDLSSEVEEAMADDDFLNDTVFIKNEIQDQKETIETAIKEVDAKISELDNNNGDDDESDIVLIAVFGSLGGLLVLVLVGGAIYTFIIKPKRSRDVKKSYSDDTDANVSKPDHANLPTTSSSNTKQDNKVSPSDSDDSSSSGSDAEEITSVTMTTTGEGGTLDNQQQKDSSPGPSKMVPVSEL